MALPLLPEGGSKPSACPTEHSRCCGCTPQTARAAQGHRDVFRGAAGMAHRGLCRFHTPHLENLYWWQGDKALLSPGVLKGEDRFFSWGKAGTPADLGGFTPVEQLVQGSPSQSAPNSLLPSGTGSAPSQREGCHLQHCAQRFLRHHGLPWTSPVKSLSGPAPWNGGLTALPWQR